MLTCPCVRIVQLYRCHYCGFFWQLNTDFCTLNTVLVVLVVMQRTVYHRKPVEKVLSVFAAKHMCICRGGQSVGTYTCIFRVEISLYSALLLRYRYPSLGIKTAQSKILIYITWTEMTEVMCCGCRVYSKMYCAGRAIDRTKKHLNDKLHDV